MDAVRKKWMIVSEKRLWILLLAVAAPLWPQSCDPDPSTRKVMEQVELPDDLRLPTADRQNQKIAVLRQALAASPKDVFLHGTYQRIKIDALEINRDSLIAEYEELLAKNPQDPVFLYLAANSQVGHKTKEAVANLKLSIDLAPSLGLPHLLLAEIYLANSYRDEALHSRKTTFVALWASWCGPCIAELPYVEKLYHHFEGRDDVAILALNVDDEPA